MKKKAGRTLTQIKWNEVELLLMAGCKGTDIALHLGVHPETLYRRCERDNKINFSEYLRQKRAKGNSLIRLAQFDEAVRQRDRGMLIWLGKNRLGQSDKAEVAHKGEMPIQLVSYSEAY